MMSLQVRLYFFNVVESSHHKKIERETKISEEIRSSDSNPELNTKLEMKVAVDQKTPNNRVRLTNFRLSFKCIIPRM